MAKEIPFDDDMMSVIMGIGGPEKPGQHGRTNMPAPSADAVELVTNIRDMCDDWLEKAGKESEKKDSKPSRKSGDKSDDKMEEIDFDEEEE